MKKQLLVVAIATTLAAPAMADLSIMGNAKFEYIATQAKDKDGKEDDSNATNTEVNLNFRGKSGDTAVVLDVEFNTHGGNLNSDSNEFIAGVAGTTTGNVNKAALTDSKNTIDVENMYLTTKLGPIGFKGGNYSSSTSALLGEIDNGSRATNKFNLDYTVNGFKVYAGTSGKTKSKKKTPVKSQMYAGVQATLAGWKLQLKRNNKKKNSFGMHGKAGPIGVRFEYVHSKKDDSKDANSDTENRNTGYFLNLTTKLSNIELGFGYVKMRGDGGITEDDSSIFAVANGADGNLTEEDFGDSNMQLSASTKIDGTTYEGKFGQIGVKNKDLDKINYYEVSAARPIASGAKVKVAYTSQKQDEAKEDVLELDISVKF